MANVTIELSDQSAEFVDAKAKPEEPVDRVEAIPQSVCGLPMATVEESEEGEGDEE